MQKKRKKVIEQTINDTIGFTRNYLKYTGESIPTPQAKHIDYYWSKS